MRTTCAVLMALVLAACGGGGGDNGSGNGGSGSGGGFLGGNGGDGLSPDDPAAEFSGAVSAQLDDRGAAGVAGLGYVLLQGQTVRISDRVSIRYSDGFVDGGLVRDTDIDDPIYTNPANGEYSRIVRITDGNLFGAVGLDVQSGDLPTTGTSDYDQGWVGMTAAFEDNVYVLEGNASFTATWSGSANVDGQFVNLSGTDAQNNSVNAGSITLNNATISGDSFTGGTVTGTGLFGGLGGGSLTAGTFGTFFGPDADELGGVLVINDTGEDIQVFGAFQAD